MRTAKTLIRLGGCPSWSKSSLGAPSFCLFYHVAAQSDNCKEGNIINSDNCLVPFLAYWPLGLLTISLTFREIVVNCQKQVSQFSLFSPTDGKQSRVILAHDISRGYGNNSQWSLTAQWWVADFMPAEKQTRWVFYDNLEDLHENMDIVGTE